jgi:hypothetical protein
MTTPLNSDQLAQLREIDVPTMSNIIELFDVRPRNEGFMLPHIRCQTPDVGVVAGYACTGMIRGNTTHEVNSHEMICRYMEWSQEIPGPKFGVIQDVDDPPFTALVGEVMANIHRAAGFVAHACSSFYRDVKEVDETGLAVFCQGRCVSHGYVSLVDFGKPVQVGDLIVHPGDLLHGDLHGVIKIPNEIAADVAGRLKDIHEKEGPVIALAKSKEFSIKRLREAFGL